MKVLAVVLAMATLGAGQTFAGGLLGVRSARVCNVGTVCNVGAVSTVSVQSVVQPVVSQRIRTGLFGRTVISAPRVRNRVVQQVVQQQVLAPQVVQQVVPHVVQTVQAAPVVASFAPLAISGYSAAGYGYAGYADAGTALPEAIRAEALENKATLAAMVEYLDSLNLEVGLPGK